MTTIHEYDLELSQRLERRLDRDDEREHIAWRRLRRPRKPRYSRFKTISRLMEGLAENWPSQDVPSVRREAA